MEKNINESIKKWIIWGIPFIFLIGSVMHFLYDLSGESLIIGLFTPVNESVWEHLKMTFYPTIIWWLISYIKLSKNHSIPINKWIYSCMISFVFSMLFIVAFHYTYKGALGEKSTFLDILSFLVGIILGQYLSIHIYMYKNFKKYHLYLSLFITTLIFASFIIFTLYPPHLPIFLDNNTLTYGIK